MDRFTIKDVAKLGGVSVATVSRVINNYPFVSEKTRKKVQQIIDKLGYKPDTIARSLVTRKSGTIGVIFWDIANPFNIEIVRVIEDKCRKSNYQAIFCSTGGNYAVQAKCIDLLLQKNTEGFIFASAYLHDPEIEKLLLRKSPPIVLINRKLRTELVDYVVADNLKGAYLAVSHLIGHGHRQIACVTGLTDISTGLERLEGYKKALSEHGIPIREDLIIRGDFRQESGHKAAKKILSFQKNRPTAIFCSNDFMALGMMEEFWKQGIKVPQDFALIGFDDIHISSFKFIELTTVSQRRSDIAKKAVDILAKKISNPASNKYYRITLKPKLIIRKSCGCS